MSEKREISLDKFKGCLLGGAVGDALGYAVEFDTLSSIRATYGEGGIMEYKLSGGKALISDDTQMTLFTATGLLYAKAQEQMSGTKADYAAAVWGAYQDWLITQCDPVDVPGPHFSRLFRLPELCKRRAPGNTCLMALIEEAGGTVESPINDSKGCGGVMRVAPVGLFFAGQGTDIYDADMFGAAAAALTHGHELGYIPAAALTHIVYGLVSGQTPDLECAVRDGVAAAKKLFPKAVHLEYFTELIERAMELAHTDMTDTEAISQLGEGWVAEETLAIAVYCALKYRDDFQKAMVASVNHSGDSDSTGAVTGNILGAYLGLSEIPEKFLTNLEMKSLIEETAEDLYTGYCDSEQWKRKYNELSI